MLEKSSFIVRAGAPSNQQILPFGIPDLETASQMCDTVSKIVGAQLEVVEVKTVYRSPVPIALPPSGLVGFGSSN